MNSAGGTEPVFLSSAVTDVVPLPTARGLKWKWNERSTCEHSTVAAEHNSQHNVHALRHQSPLACEHSPTLGQRCAAAGITATRRSREGRTSAVGSRSNLDARLKMTSRIVSSVPVDTRACFARVRLARVRLASVRRTELGVYLRQRALTPQRRRRDAVRARVDKRELQRCGAAVTDRSALRRGAAKRGYSARPIDRAPMAY